MGKYFSILILLIFYSQLSFGQTINEYYISIPVDSTKDCRLKFINDSTVILSTVKRHLSGGQSMTLKFKNSDTAIDIMPKLSSQDSLALDLYKLPYFLRPVIHLTKINNNLIDYSKSLIYVRQKNLKENSSILYIIDGKKFKQKIGKTSGYGIITKTQKSNQRLQRQLKFLNIDNCSIELVRGLNAYNRFGLKYVYGVVVISTKNILKIF